MQGTPTRTPVEELKPFQVVVLRQPQKIVMLLEKEHDAIDGRVGWSYADIWTGRVGHANVRTDDFAWLLVCPPVNLAKAGA